MKITSYRNIALFASFLGFAFQASAGSFTLADGNRVVGEIQSVVGDSITLKSSEGSKTSLRLSEFDGASKKLIKNWKQENPSKTDVFTKWDAQPVLKTKTLPQLPEQLRSTAFSGTASIELIVDERGKVIHASVSKSSHPDLEAPSIEATKSWKFQPAKVDGRSVKSKLRVPFNFENTAPVVEEVDTLDIYRGAPYSIL